MKYIPAFTWLLLTAMPASAYIGPGAGLGAFALTIGLALGVLLLLIGFLWYPLKRLLRRGKTRPPAEQDR